MGTLARVVAELHAEPPLYHEKHLVFVVVVMPDELALELDQLDELSIEFARNVRLTVLVDFREFRREINLIEHKVHR